MVPARVNFDMDVLRSFVLGVEEGSFARAAEQVGRSASAVSLQLRKLEQQCGQTVLVKNGRGLELTEAGQVFLFHARRILAANDEAQLAMRAIRPLTGRLAIGVPQDFAETWLPDLLARFCRLHPDVSVEVQVDRAATLIENVERSGLDLALVWQADIPAGCDHVWQTPMHWIGHQGHAERPLANPVPLVSFASPCAFRQAALNLLQEAGLGWRQAVASPGLSGIWASVRAGLGVTIRTRMGLPEDVIPLPTGYGGLPQPGIINLALHRSALGETSLVDIFSGLLVERLDALMERVRAAAPKSP